MFLNTLIVFKQYFAKLFLRVHPFLWKLKRGRNGVDSMTFRLIEQSLSKRLWKLLAFIARWLEVLSYFAIFGYTTLSYDWLYILCLICSTLTPICSHGWWAHMTSQLKCCSWSKWERLNTTSLSVVISLTVSIIHLNEIEYFECKIIAQFEYIELC